MLDEDPGKVSQILEDAGPAASDLINEDETTDCIYNCIRTRNQQSPLNTAVCRGNLDIAVLLLKYGADVDSQGYWGQSSLQQAAHRGDLPMCKMLVEYGANLQQTDWVGKRVIHCTALSMGAEIHKTTDCLKYIYKDIGQPDDIHLRDNLGKTPLHDAARMGNKLVVESLIIYGADINAKDNEGKTPLDEARAFNRHHVVHYLEQYSSATTKGTP